MNYDPKDAVQLFPDGDYDAELLSYEEKTSKAGNDMAVLVWKVYGPDDKHQQITDRIVFPMFTWKWKRLAQSLGLLKEFESGKFQSVEPGISTRVQLIIRQQLGFEERNEIKTYIGKDELPGMVEKGKHDKDIPF